MTAPDPGAVLARAGVWVAGLRAAGQIEAPEADRLDAVLAESFGERLDQVDDSPLVVMLCGPTAVGKSSLINALAGADISRSGFGATTRAAVLYVHEDDDPERLFAYSHALAGRAAQADTAIIRHRRDELRHKILVDTPDIDSVRVSHRKLTAELVHAADLVLFVTSPEKYKVLRAARWILDQRGQRALAFVLNKWDRAALGVQSERRQLIADDFRTVLSQEGFADPLVFRISALPGSSDLENELPELRGWLEAGIGQSTAAAIRRRRVRAAWSRVAAEIERACPPRLSGQTMLAGLQDAITRQAGVAQLGVAADAAILPLADLDEQGWPESPGLLGIWVRAMRRIGGAASGLRAGLTTFTMRADAGNRVSIPSDAFGLRHVAALSETATQAAGEAAALGLRLGGVPAQWRVTFDGVLRSISVLPLDVAAEAVASANRMSLRRVAGLAFIGAVELLVLAVLLTALWRAGSDFIAGTYAPGSLLATVVLLLFVLLLLGQSIGNWFFPRLRRRVRRGIARAARDILRDASTQALAALQGHAAAVDRLADEEQALVTDIEAILLSLAAAPSETAPVSRLFADTGANATLPEYAQSRPVFD